MIYVPADISVDSLFQSIFEIGKPVELRLDAEKKEMVVRPINENEEIWYECGENEAQKNSYANRHRYFLRPRRD